MRKFFRRMLYWRQLWRAGVSVRPGVTIISPQSLVLGRNCHIGSDCFLDARGGLQIGDGTIFANEVKILTYNHNLRDRKQTPYDVRLEKKKVVIGSGCWLGRNVLVAPGANMGNGAVAGLGTVVVGTVAANTLVIGNPQRKMRELENVDELYRENGKRSSLFQIIRYVRLRGL